MLEGDEVITLIQEGDYQDYVRDFLMHPFNGVSLFHRLILQLLIWVSLNLHLVLQFRLNCRKLVWQMLMVPNSPTCFNLASKETLCG